MENQNTKEYLEKCRSIIIENLRNLQFAPSVQMQTAPNDLLESSDDEEIMDIRSSVREKDQRIVPDDELTDSEDEGDNRRNRSGNSRRPQRNSRKKDLTSDENLVFEKSDSMDVESVDVQVEKMQISK